MFLDFNDSITLSISKKDNLKNSRDALRTKIKYYFKENDKNQPKFCWQGSFSMKTTINPYYDSEYDIDDGVYLQDY